MIIEILVVGMILGFVYYEITGVSPGGVIAPGYVALYVHQPNRIAMTIVLAFIVWGALNVGARYLILYGRRRLLVAVLISVCLKLVVQRWIQPMPALPFDIQSIGYIIPGLIANEMIRQRVVPTLAGLGTVTLVTFLIFQLLPP